jgi:type VI protein secretion system component Hcp
VPGQLYLSIPGLTDQAGTAESGIATIDSVQYLQLSSFDVSVAGLLGAPASPAGAGAGKVQFSPFSVTLPVNHATPQLFQACAAGREFPAATLLVRTGGPGPQVTAQQYSFKLVVVRSLTISETADSSQQTVTVEYGAVSISYTPVTGQGQPGTPVTGGWNQVSNAPA